LGRVGAEMFRYTVFWWTAPAARSSWRRWWLGGLHVELVGG
jgi:hypothetical protein